MPSYLLRIVLAISWLFGVSIVVAENVIANPGFEVAGSGGQADSADWEQFFNFPVDGAKNERSSLMPSTGGWSHHLSTQGTSSNGGSVVVQQSQRFLGGPSLMELQPVVVSFDYKSFETTTSTRSVEFAIVNGSGSVVTSNAFLLPVNTPDFTRFETPPFDVPAFGPAPNDAYFTQIAFRVESSLSPIHFAETFLDNVVINAVLVPEPGLTIPNIALIACFGFLLRKTRAFQR